MKNVLGFEQMDHNVHWSPLRKQGGMVAVTCEHLAKLLALLPVTIGNLLVSFIKAVRLQYGFCVIRGFFKREEKYVGFKRDSKS